MLTKYSKTLIVLFVFTAIFLVHCVPPPATETKTDVTEKKEEAKKDFDKSTCDKYLSFAYSYYQNQDWKGCVKNYRKMLEADCEEEYANDIFPYMGKAYRELRSESDEYLDSAAFTYQRGLEYLPSNTSLRKNLAYIYALQGKTNMEIREYEKLAERDPEEISYYEKLVKLYFKRERFEDVTWAAGKILDLDPGNQQALNDRMLAYKKMGKDIITVQKEAWQENPTASNGIDYAKALEERNEYQKAISVLKKVTQIAPSNYEAWQKLGNNYQNVNDTKNVIKTFTHIATKISPRDLNVISNIVEAQLTSANYEKAYEWAKRAYSVDEQSKIANKLMGDVYYGAAEYHTSSRDVNFEDKLVYKLAYDYYKKANELGDYGVKSRLDQLKEYRIPTKEDWFMNKYDEGDKERTDYTPKMECYNWIEEGPIKE